MTQDERRRVIPLATRAALASVAMACFLLLLKGFAAWTTGSVAMLGSLADTALDLLASLVTLYGVRLAAQQQSADRAGIDFIVERVEGNLLAAHQELQKLALLHPPGKLGFEAIHEAVLNVAR